MNSLRRPVFWNFGLLYFFYFATWQLSATFLPMWLQDTAGMNAMNIGILNTIAALGALILQPIFGPLQDKLALKKHLFYLVVICILCLGPLFNWVFLPLIRVNQIAGAAVAGGYLSLCLNGGVGIIEAYNERSSRAHDFEYGHARLFGSLAGATASFVGGFMYAANPSSVFWGMTFCGAVLIVLISLVRVPQDAMERAEGLHDEQRVEVTREDFAKNTWRNRSFWGFVLLIIGSATMYDIFDQQFANYFSAMFVQNGMGSLTQGEALFANVVSIQILLEALFMVIMPALINRIGAKTGLILYGLILFVRVLGCAFIPSVPVLIFWRLLASLEMPFMLVSVMKYITRVFDKKVSATVYMYGFGTAKQVGVFIFSITMGAMINGIGFKHAYLVLAVIIIVLVVLGASLMRSDVLSSAEGKDAKKGASLA
ncbi:oligosaccharide/H+ symporter, major facilitator superfamily (MFS) [Coriobacterium glomerans PW2]|uniref:Oligosaccharide/H+ symporter, major facilitator superfamily (MFS) n=1 Tax=Coriobacterium glomerans (strain ATCC 49209 / DSM 20642 / JCM 10262 / PW2) TaxID=700015 RepID=F2NA49_CORGP|nr:oligosaccharide MFS transporter [Coriobacterium glomerans]AEB06443.1 oligosaccharide/H+ symporter, major facilitator superfamily (MFS) [Coriobacterium glomerans PW2]